MTNSDREAHFDDDAAFVAYLDGEADAEEAARIGALAKADVMVAGRLDALSSARSGIAEAYRPLLDAAPLFRLETMLRSLPDATAASAPRSWRRREVLAAGIALFIAGVVAGRSPDIVGRLRSDGPDDDWREAVAQYWSLYTPETLGNLAADQPTIAREFSDAGGAVGLAVTPQAVRIDGAEFKRAQTFRYDGRPLAQFAYLDRAFGPMALCVIEKPGPVEPVRTERRLGMNVAFWASATHRFMLIGRRPVGELEALATAVAPAYGA